LTIIKTKSKNLKELVKIANQAIKKGKIIILPTDTVYGLICDTTNRTAIERLFKIKKRKSSKAIPIFIKNIKTAKDLAWVDKKQEGFLKKVWPGKVTAVLKAKNKKRFPKGIISKDEKIGLRISNYKFLNQILTKANLPLTATSANISGKPASTKIKDVISQFENQKFKPDLIFNGGDLKKSKPSKVIDLTGEKLKILRNG